jgi:hypothetical protein
MSKYASITQEYLKSILDYNPDTGIFVWRERPVEDFKSEIIWKAWNTRFSGKQAGYLNNEGYIKIGIKYTQYGAHVLAYIYMTGNQPKKYIDHDNGNGSDNRWVNLRPATESQNIANSKIRKDNKCGFKGISFDKKRNKYLARIVVNGKSINLGRFNTPEEAHKTYCEAAEKYYGEFAREK